MKRMSFRQSSEASGYGCLLYLSFGLSPPLGGFRNRKIEKFELSKTCLFQARWLWPAMPVPGRQGSRGPEASLFSMKQVAFLLVLFSFLINNFTR